MSVNFGSNSYLSLVRQGSDFKNDQAICSYAKNHPQFFYGDVSFSKFSNSYSEGRSFANRLASLPANTLNSAIFTLYHLGLAVFKGMPQLACGNSLYLQGLAFTLVRDVQLIIGCITDIFFEKIGQYLMLDALFHIQCYKCFITPSQSSPSSPERHPSSPERHPSSPERHPSSGHFSIPEVEEEVPTHPNLLQAEEDLRQGKRQEALTEIQKLSLASKVKEPFLAKLAEAHLEEKEYKQALKVIKEIFHDHGRKETFLAKLAEAHLEEREYDQALKVIKEIFHDHGRKETFLAKLAEAHLEEKEYDQAFEVIKEIIHDPGIMEKLTGELLQASYDLDKHEQVKKVTLTFVRIVIIKRLLKDRVYRKSVTAIMTNQQMRLDLQKISQECFVKAEPLLKEGKSQEAILEVKRSALSDKVMSAVRTALTSLSSSSP